MNRFRYFLLPIGKYCEGEISNHRRPKKKPFTCFARITHSILLLNLKLKYYNMKLLQ